MDRVDKECEDNKLPKPDWERLEETSPHFKLLWEAAPLIMQKYNTVVVGKI
mgnify:CR=1 FL=1